MLSAGLMIMVGFFFLFVNCPLIIFVFKENLKKKKISQNDVFIKGLNTQDLVG